MINRQLLISKNSFVFLISFICLSTTKFLIGSWFILNDNNNTFGEGNDADYYHSVASNENLNIVNDWGLWLKWLNEIGLYNRDFFSIIILFSSVVVIPLLAYRSLQVATHNQIKLGSKETVFLLSYILFSPTIFYYSLDIYRDVVMLLCVSILLYILCRLEYSYVRYSKLFFICLLMLACFVAFSLRWYLGISIIFSLICAYIVKLNLVRFFILCLGSFLTVTFSSIFGYLDSALVYRSRFFEGRGGSSYSPIFQSDFLAGLNWIQGFIYQFFGFYFPNPGAIVIFFTESLFFVVALKFLAVELGRRKFDYVSSFSMYFLISYGSIVCLANGNLGTGTRLRLFAYLLIVFTYCIVRCNRRTEERFKSISEARV